MPIDVSDGQTCMLIVSGLSHSACASWVQAWGSIFAILAAVGVAGWQQWTQARAATAAARVAAELAATGVLLRMNAIIGSIGAVQRELPALMPRTGTNAQALALAEILGRQDYPADDDVVAIAGQAPTCAHMLVRGRNLARHAEVALRLTAEQAHRLSGADLTKYVTQVSRALAAAKDQYERATSSLDRIAPDV
jgi:hypothetical protein